MPEQDNRRRLEEEGIVFGEVPDAHAAVIDDLTVEEIEVIVTVKKRLEKADKEAGLGQTPGDRPGYAAIMHF